MEHEKFPLEGFGFMNEPATMIQKQLIAELAKKNGTPIDINGTWPDPFSKWDAANMISNLEEIACQRSENEK